jgi:hypothetical protein
MTTREQILSSAALATDKQARSLASWIKSIGGRIAAWADTCADYYAAAAMYEQLAALSDAELMRRGLSRATLAHDVRTSCDRGSKPRGDPLGARSASYWRWCGDADDRFWHISEVQTPSLPVTGGT